MKKTALATRQQVVVIPEGQTPKIRSNATSFKVDLYQPGEKRKEVQVRKGEILCQVLDREINVSNGSPSDFDIRINGKPASLRQVINPGDCIYFSAKVAGA